MHNRPPKRVMVAVVEILDGRRNLSRKNNAEESGNSTWPIFGQAYDGSGIHGRTSQNKLL